MTNRLPEWSEDKTSQTGNYFKFKDGDNKIRILTSPIVWYVYFNVDNKPTRSKEVIKDPIDIKEDWKVKQFWAMWIWNYDEKKIQVMEITQASIKQQLTWFINDEDYGSPLEYDIKINRTGKWLDTEYQVKPLSKTPVSAEITEELMETNINLEKLFEGGHPLSSN